MKTNGVFTPEQDDDKTTTRQMLNLLDRCERHHRNALGQHLSCHWLVVVLLWCENMINFSRPPPPRLIMAVHLVSTVGTAQTKMPTGRKTPTQTIKNPKCMGTYVLRGGDCLAVKMDQRGENGVWMLDRHVKHMAACMQVYITCYSHLIWRRIFPSKEPCKFIKSPKGGLDWSQIYLYIVVAVSE